jgi:hypothetical protein
MASSWREVLMAPFIPGLMTMVSYADPNGVGVTHIDPAALGCIGGLVAVLLRHQPSNLNTIQL